MTSRDAEILVVGGGMAGRLCALALRHAGLDACVLARGGDGADPRTTALAYASVRALRRLGVWTHLEADAHPVRDIVVAPVTPADRFRVGATGPVLHFGDDFLSDTERWDGTPLAYMVRNDALTAAIRAASEDVPTITGEARSLSAGAEARVTLADGRRLTADLVVACDGGRSRLRRASGVRALERDMRQDALTLVVAHDRPHEGVARQVFPIGGPLAALPLTNDRSCLVWSMPRAEVDAYEAAGPEAFCAAAVAALGDALGSFIPESDLARFPLRTLLAERLFADRLALVGDAAHVVHPLAGQGFNVSVADIAALSDVLAEARGTGLDIGHGAVLAGYDRWRRPAAAAMVAGTGALNRLLSTSERVTRTAASLGLGAVQRREGLRARLARAAGGEAGRLPSLMVR